MKKSLLALLLLASCIYGASDSQKETVRVQLKWFHMFQFAGFYAAKEKGFYDEAGLDVKILERDPAKNNIEQVVNGEAEYGVADSALLLYRAKGVPVKLLASVFQHCPLVFISKKSSGIVSPLEMKGKRVSFQKNIDDAPLVAMLQEGNLKESDYTFVPLDFTKMDFIVSKVDVTTAYLTQEPYEFKQMDLDVNIINPLSYGIDFYGDNIFTTDAEIKNHPERALKFVKATLKGWKYALGHKEEIAHLIHNKYATNLSYEKLINEAVETEKMIVPDMIEIGYTSTDRFIRIANIYKKMGKADPDLLDKALKELTYDPNAKKDELLEYFYALLAVMALFAILTLALYKFNRSLKKLVDERTRELEERSIMLEASNTELQTTMQELKNAQKSLIESEKMASLGSLVAGVAHEINTPIGIVLTAASHLKDKSEEIAELIQEEKIKKSQFENFIAMTGELTTTVLSSTERIARLITSFKLAAADTRSESLAQFDIKKHLLSLIVIFWPQFNSRNISCEIVCDDGIIVKSYQAVISQIVTSLISNSLEHAFGQKDEGKIRIEVQKDNEQTVLTYSDDGCGIDEKTREKIFEPFFTTRRGAGSSGLGMHIVYNLVTQALKGAISCESSLGEGIRFRVVF